MQPVLRQVLDDLRQRRTAYPAEAIGRNLSIGGGLQGYEALPVTRAPTAIERGHYWQWAQGLTFPMLLLEQSFAVLAEGTESVGIRVSDDVDRPPAATDCGLRLDLDGPPRLFFDVADESMRVRKETLVVLPYGSFVHGRRGDPIVQIRRLRRSMNSNETQASQLFGHPRHQMPVGAAWMIDVRRRVGRFTGEAVTRSTGRTGTTYRGRPRST